MDCAICLNKIDQSAIGSCAHHYCYHCLCRWCEFASECPKCREPISTIRRDAEFDSLCGISPEVPRKTRGEPPLSFTITFPLSTAAGVTLTNETPGVRVKSTRENGRAYAAGIRRNDILLSLNGIPCSTHERCAEVMNRLSAAGHSIKCAVIRK